jgi:hypothetical protein
MRKVNIILNEEKYRPIRVSECSTHLYIRSDGGEVRITATPETQFGNIRDNVQRQ